MLSVPRFVLASLLTCLVCQCSFACAAESSEGEVCTQTQGEASAPVILLVHGLSWEDPNGDNVAPWEVWGERADGKWSGMIGALEARGRRFGGVACFRKNRRTLPAALDTTGVDGDSRTADFFALEFTPLAGQDGLVAKASELQVCIKELCKYCDARKVIIVAHSAGGLVARYYMQNADRGCSYRDDVDRLITIGTPHQGSVFARIVDWAWKLLNRFGGIDRISSIQVDSGFFEELNGNLDLPQDAVYASIVVRSLKKGDCKQATEYDVPDVSYLPRDYRLGNDGWVDVLSQNLILTKCADRYEEGTGQAVQAVSARVEGVDGKWAHEVEPLDSQVQSLVQMFLRKDKGVWTGTPEWKGRTEWIDLRAAECAAASVEAEANARFVLNASRVDVEVDFIREDTGGCLYNFSGKAYFKCQGEVRVEGMLRIECDRFGRIERWGIIGTPLFINLNTDRRSPGPLVDLGKKYMDKGEYSKAIGIFVDSQQRGKVHPALLCQAYTARGHRREMRGNLEGAFEDYCRAIETGKADGSLCDVRERVQAKLQEL